MNVRQSKWIIVILFACLLAIAGYSISLHHQMGIAARISGECARVERTARSTTDPVSLALDVQWLEVYYGINNERLSRSSLHRIVERNYAHAVSNSYDALKRLTTNGFTVISAAGCTDEPTRPRTNEAEQLHEPSSAIAS
jgi:hypothetical protein